MATAECLLSTAESTSSRVLSLDGSVTQWKKSHSPSSAFCDDLYTHTHTQKGKKKNNKTNLCHCNVSMLKRNHHLVIAADWGGASVIFYCTRCATRLPHPTVYCCQSDYSDSHHRGCTEVFKKLRRKGKTVPQRSEPKAPRFKSGWSLFM